MKGLKDHKKAQKAKQVAKRNAAAEKSKAHKASSVVIAKDMTPCKQATLGPEEAPVKDENTTEKVISINGETTGNDLILTNHAVGDMGNLPVTTANHAIAETHSTETPSSPVFDIHAHRKALEAALYDNMETPKQMLARLESMVITADAEFHQEVGVDEPIVYMDELDVDDFIVTPKCRDDNGFEALTARNNLSDNVLLNHSLPIAQLSAGATMSSSETPDATATKIQSPTIEELFAMVASTGAKKVGDNSNATNSRTIESVEADLVAHHTEALNALEHFHQGRAISMEQLFASASSTNTKSLRHPNATTQEPSTAPNISLNPEAKPFLPLIDPAMISMKVKKTEDAANSLKALPAHDIASRTSNHILDAGSEKLKSILGIGSSSGSASGSAHSRGSSPIEGGCNTSITHYSASPPPFGSYGLDPACGPWYPGFGSYHGQYPGPEYYGPGLFKQQYARFQQDDQLDMFPQPYNRYGW